jgi:2-C-methyl-D-erythritol 4-phosphate cytidylyltransferase/2-C-methyl-D-erythritol 2,4-cyclodiphosphate synthase
LESDVAAGVLLLGGGRGERLSGPDPKAFALLDGRTLLELAVSTVEACGRVEGFVVVAPEGWEERARTIVGPRPRLIDVVAGGGNRQDSVRRGLAALPEPFDVVICHDVARPLASAELFDAVLGGLAGADGSVPSVPVPDTVKRVDDGMVAETVHRDGLVLVQTPQAFTREALTAAHRAAEADGFTGTDDAALLERAGFRVAVVPGDTANIKITRPEDLKVASALSRA